MAAGAHNAASMLQACNPEILLRLVLLSEGEDRRSLRACTSAVARIGNSFAAKVHAHGPYGPYYARMSFWSPFVGYRVVRLDASLRPPMYYAAMDEMAPGDRNANRTKGGSSFEVHGCSSHLILYHISVKQEWVPEMRILDGDALQL